MFQESMTRRRFMKTIPSVSTGEELLDFHRGRRAATSEVGASGEAAEVVSCSPILPAQYGDRKLLGADALRTRRAPQARSRSGSSSSGVHRHPDQREEQHDAEDMSRRSSMNALCPAEVNRAGAGGRGGPSNPPRTDLHDGLPIACAGFETISSWPAKGIDGYA